MTQVLRGATVVDGTGAPGRRADVMIEDGKIAAIGDIDQGVGTDVDCTGLVVCPGFIDIHTHLDAQVFWDPDYSSSAPHGVTTVIQGNTGFGIAPARPGDRQMVMETLALVEGMSKDTLAAGIDWRYETFPEYLDVLRSLPKRINVAAYVPHSMVRLFVMGAEAAFTRAADDTEREAIAGAVLEALRAGAIGWSTSQAPSHQGPHGAPVPSRLADRAEIEALCAAVATHGRGTCEITYGPLYEVEDIADLSERHGIRFTWGSVIPGLFGGPGSAMEMLERSEAAGGDVTAQTSTRYITTVMSLANPYQWSRIPSFKEVIGRSHDVMVKLYSDPEWRARAKAETAAQGEIDPDFLDGDIEGYYQRTSVDETVHHEALRGRSLADLAAERGVDPLDVMIDLALEDDLATRFRNLPRVDESELTQLVTDPRMVLGAHDAGAHVDMLCDSCYPTYTLRYWVREQGAMSLEDAIWRMTGQPADLFGLDSRGRLLPGLVADVVAFDPETVGETPLHRVYDFPANGERLTSEGIGIEHVWVGGVQTYENGKPVEGAYPGAVVSD